MVYDKEKRPVPVIIVAGMGKRTRVIGRGNQLLWHVPEDLRRFKALTLGHPIIMGRKTFESILAILRKPLPDRHNIVITRDTSYHHEGITIAHSLTEAFDIALSDHPTEIHIGGGASLYAEALPYVDRLFLTIFDDDPGGDAYFPAFDNEFSVIRSSDHVTPDGTPYQFVDLERTLQ